MTEIQARRDWIGVDWISEDDDELDDEEDFTSACPCCVRQPEKKTVRLLDYACGTGLVSRVCCPLSSFANDRSFSCKLLFFF